MSVAPRNQLGKEPLKSSTILQLNTMNSDKTSVCGFREFVHCRKQTGVAFGHLQLPYADTKRSWYFGFQLRAVLAIFFTLSKLNFHRGSKVPSLSLNSSDGSSQYLKSTSVPVFFSSSEWILFEEMPRIVTLLGLSSTYITCTNHELAFGVDKRECSQFRGSFFFFFAQLGSLKQICTPRLCEYAFPLVQQIRCVCLCERGGLHNVWTGPLTLCNVVKCVLVHHSLHNLGSSGYAWYVVTLQLNRNQMQSSDQKFAQIRVNLSCLEKKEKNTGFAVQNKKVYEWQETQPDRIVLLPVW